MGGVAISDSQVIAILRRELQGFEIGEVVHGPHGRREVVVVNDGISGEHRVQFEVDLEMIFLIPDNKLSICEFVSGTEEQEEALSELAVVARNYLKGNFVLTRGRTLLGFPLIKMSIAGFENCYEIKRNTILGTGSTSTTHIR